MSEQKTCFVIAPIGEPESATRKRSDQIFKHVITPAAKECGYSSIRADQISEPGIITTQVIQHIVEDPLVIADLTGRNPNVFYELAIRHALRKPLIQIIQEGEPIPFDVAATRTIQVNHNDLDSVEEAKAEIVRQIKAVEEDPSKIDTPISVALDVQILRQSENPEQRSLAEIVKAVSELRSIVLAFAKRLGDPQFILPYLEDFLIQAQQYSYLDICSDLEEVIGELEELEFNLPEIETIIDKLALLRSRIVVYMKLPVLIKNNR